MNTSYSTPGWRRGHSWPHTNTYRHLLRDPERRLIISGFHRARRYIRRPAISPQERIIDERLDPETKAQLAQIPVTGSPDCLKVVRGMGVALLPSTVMVLLHEANSIGDVTLVDVLQKRLLGEGQVDDFYDNGVANPLIESLAKWQGYRSADAIDDFRQECHLRMARHIQARKGNSTFWETKDGFRIALIGIAIEVGRFFKANKQSRRPTQFHQSFDVIDSLEDPEEPFEAYEKKEVDEAIMQALERIPPAEAEVIRRYDFDEDTFAQMATESGRDEGTFRHRRTRGLRRLGIDLDRFRDLPSGGGR